MKIKQYVKELRSLRDCYSNEIPDKIMHSDTCGAERYKIRKAWLTNVCLWLSVGCNHGFFNSELEQECMEFLDYVDREKIA